MNRELVFWKTWRLHISGASAGKKHVPRDRGTKRSRASLQVDTQQVTERKSNGRAERRYLEEQGGLLPGYLCIPMNQVKRTQTSLQPCWNGPKMPNAHQTTRRPPDYSPAKRRSWTLAFCTAQESSMD
ncbi:Hypothetical predicted protein [Podarcis lilfordi]|uniref:Uncharacterized protein n=1 Tax=Podarcis lilfordi TaxID=74358 RepID=A0AA35JQX6_9SAUR|nr:Hypothetical predicted protein [Podarcis lilfordi]